MILTFSRSHSVLPALEDDGDTEDSALSAHNEHCQSCNSTPEECCVCEQSAEEHEHGKLHHCAGCRKANFRCQNHLEASSDMICRNIILLELDVCCTNDEVYQPHDESRDTWYQRGH